MTAPQHQRTNSAKGHVKGAFAPFVSGHNRCGSTALLRHSIASNGCWVWDGSKDHKGYGRAQVNRVRTPAQGVARKAVAAAEEALK